MKRNDSQLAAKDAQFDRMHAEIRDADRNDLAEWSRFTRKINAAANTRADCAATTFTREEMYQLVRLADLGAMYVTGRLLGRKL